jgi:multiple sugar transport system permease protein
VDVALSAPSNCARNFSIDLIRGDVFFWGEIMAGALIAAIPVAIAYNLFLDRFIAGITGGAVK